MKHPITPLVALAALAAAGAGHATQLTFDAFNAATYGDRLSGSGPGWTNNGGDTPNITLDFATLSGRPFTVYSGGYGPLSFALGHTAYNEPGYFRLTPDAGWDVVLQGFQIAGWSVNSYPNSRIWIVDGAGITRYDSGVFTFAPSTVLQLPAAPIRSSGPLTVYVNDFGDLGVDNIVFSQVTAVPEAPPAAMLAAGLGLLGLLSRGRAWARARRQPAPAR